MHKATLLRGLTNIGPTIADRLETVGVRTLGDLERIGPARVFRRLQQAYADRTIPVCYYLYSLQGALDGKHWNDIGAATKQRLLAEAGMPDRRGRASG